MFVGRLKELDQLNGLWNKVTRTSLVTIRGRRRIGKSTLVEHFAALSNARFLKIEGLSPKTAKSSKDQLKGFYSQLQLQSGKSYEIVDWLKAFKDLDDEITDDRRTVLLLDGLNVEQKAELQVEGKILASPAVYNDIMVIGTSGKGTESVVGIRIR